MVKLFPWALASVVLALAFACSAEQSAPAAGGGSDSASQQLVTLAIDGMS
jgi:hypothetical protein